jgi:hypothetical protein
MRFVALMLAVAILGAGVGLVSVAPVQAHGGDGGGAIELMAGFPHCPVVLKVLNDATPNTTSCDDLNESLNSR